MQALKYFIPRNQRPQYKLHSDILELVTIIECVCTDGSSLKPGFIFPGKEHHPEWFEVDKDIRYVNFQCKSTRNLSNNQHWNVRKWMDR